MLWRNVNKKGKEKRFDNDFFIFRWGTARRIRAVSLVIQHTYKGHHNIWSLDLTRVLYFFIGLARSRRLHIIAFNVFFLISLCWKIIKRKDREGAERNADKGSKSVGKCKFTFCCDLNKFLSQFHKLDILMESPNEAITKARERNDFLKSHSWIA